MFGFELGLSGLQLSHAYDKHQCVQLRRSAIAAETVSI